jgi:putative transposase
MRSRTSSSWLSSCLAQAKEQGVELVGPDGLLNPLTKRVLGTAVEEEMAEHLGYDRHDPVGRNRGSSRSGVRSDQST